ncbi:hypothetical protein Rhopal_005714-T1 [Rhodotorula paludigena]|uniref:LAGLIDADG endonuclease n=1 Tax=Rhodotorula paludigena TaxID=86838 RepID=A0AAV5GQ92_9BASI|nr:hypothetical protein Rhopal_005714-T1 [Rhodotorula paludigena]
MHGLELGRWFVTFTNSDHVRHLSGSVVLDGKEIFWVDVEDLCHCFEAVLRYSDEHTLQGFLLQEKQSTVRNVTKDMRKPTKMRDYDFEGIVARTVERNCHRSHVSEFQTTKWCNAEGVVYKEVISSKPYFWDED